MSETLRQIAELIRAGQVLISAHGYDEMAEDGVLVAEALEGGNSGLDRDYPKYAKGPCTLVLQRDRSGRPIHVVWGIPRGQAVAGRLGHRVPER